ncbi:MAG: hypothetical protein AAGE59_31230 [Cyanobacteria bacterium P01_F01_bin.86]
MKEVSYRLEHPAPKVTASVQNSALLVVIFLILGLGLRILNIDLKPAWMDEVSTLIFSLGNSSYFIPTETIVDVDSLLRPIMHVPEATPLDSARYLLQENNHPPAYFMLAHLWMDVFPPADGIASITIARLFSVILGSLSIPLIYWAAKVAFQSSLAGVLSAAFMAVSPLGIFLSQEARHYGLAITLITASLGCFITAARAVWQQKTPAWHVCVGWILINGLAIANHYFSVLTFGAQGTMMALIALQQARQNGPAILWKSHWRRIYYVAVGTLAGFLVWLPILLNFYGSPQSSFLQSDGDFSGLINPVAHTLGAFIFSLVTPAIFFAKTPLDIGLMVGSIVLTLILIGFFIPVLWKGLKHLWQQPQDRIGVIIVGGFLITMLTVFALICYGYGSDITRGLRYKFSYYPAILILAGGIFSAYWSQRSPNGSLSVTVPFRKHRLSGRRLIQLTWTLSLISTLLVVTDFAFIKFYAPDRFIPFVQQHSENPIVFATTEEIAAQPTVIGAKFLSIGWEIERHYPPEAEASGWALAPKFFVLREGYGIETSVASRLDATVNQIPLPFDLWAIRRHIDQEDPFLTDIPSVCRLDSQTPHGNKGGYSYVHYQCDG